MGCIGYCIGARSVLRTIREPASANTALIQTTNALAKGEAEIHDGADHGFGVYGPAHHEAAAARSYERAKVRFDRELEN